MEWLGKAIGRLELAIESSIERQLRHLEAAITAVLDKRIATVEAKVELLEAKHTLVRVIVYSVVGLIVLAFFNSLVGERIGNVQTRMLQTLPPKHSSQEK